MTNTRRALLATLLLAATAGCAGRPPAGGTVTSRDVLTIEQIAAVRATNAYEAVERLRSRWLRERGSTQVPPSSDGAQFLENKVQVYLDDQRLGDVQNLRRIEIAAVQYIRYFSPTEAAARWGFNHGGGAIYVSTRPLE